MSASGRRMEAAKPLHGSLASHTLPFFRTLTGISRSRRVLPSLLSEHRDQALAQGGRIRGGKGCPISRRAQNGSEPRVNTSTPSPAQAARLLASAGPPSQAAR